MVEENGVPGDIVTCPTCQKIWPHETKFCTQCGTWIQSGKVMDPTAAPSPGASGEPSIGSSPPGISPPGPRVGSAPPGSRRPDAGVGPQQPSVGPSPPGIGPQQPGVGPQQPGIGPQQPGLGPQQPGVGQVPGAPGAPVEGAPEGGPAPRKYAFKVEPHRDEHVPEGPLFIPKRAAKKARAFGPRQIVIVIVCVLAIAYAVISMAFKPLHGFLLGKVFQTIGKPEMAIKHYQKAARSDAPWAASSRRAMTKLGKAVFLRHIELQYNSSWTAESTIVIVFPGRPQPLQFVSTIQYDPGRVTEQITGSGATGTRVIDGEKYAHALGRARLGMSHDQYAQLLNRTLGFGPDALFEASGKEKVVDAFFDTLETELDSTLGSGDETAYYFSIPVDGNVDRVQKLSMLSGPFFPWAALVQSNTVSKVRLVIRAKDGFLERVEYLDTSGVPAITQDFEEFEPKGE